MVSLSHEKSDEGVVAYAVITRPSGLPQRSVVVRFTVKDQAKRPVLVDRAGVAMCDLGKLAIGTYRVRAEVVGTNPPDYDEETIVVSKKKKTPTGKFGVTMMILFWAIVFLFGPGKILTLALLGLTFGVLTLVARFRGASFSSVVRNNDWVFWAMLGMVAFCGLAAWLNPLLPQAKGVAFVEGLKGLFGFSSKIKLHDSVFWSMVNRLFFDRAFTRAWTSATLFYFVACFPALFISFSDELKAKWEKHRAHGGGIMEFITKDLFPFAVKDFGMEHVYKWFGWGGKK